MAADEGEWVRRRWLDGLVDADLRRSFAALTEAAALGGVEIVLLRFGRGEEFATAAVNGKVLVGTKRYCAQSTADWPRVAFNATRAEMINPVRWKKSNAVKARCGHGRAETREPEAAELTDFVYRSLSARSTESGAKAARLTPG